MAIKVENPLDPPNVGASISVSPATLRQETEMQHFNVPDMTCGHCVKTITQAVQSVDAAAQVQADLATHSIGVTSTASVANLSAAIAAAGYANTVKS
jgi:copper chaperone